MEIAIPTLRYFCVLAEELHFGRAAERLSITSPSLSQQISRLERLVGGRLFDRTSRSVSLTPLGEELVPRARRVVDAHDDLGAWVAAARAPAEPRLRLGVVAAGAGPLTAAIMAAVQEIPGLRLEMRRIGFFDVEDQLAAGHVDAVFAPAPVRADPDVVTTLALWDEPRVLVTRVDHPLAGRASISITEVSDESFIAAAGGDPATIAFWTVDPRPDGSHPRVGALADDVDGIFELVAAGVGVNIAAESARARFRRAELAFVPIADIAPATVVLCTRARLDPIVARFVSLVRAEVERGEPRRGPASRGLDR